MGNIQYSAEQKSAINAVDGVIRVIAGAGSGKTQTVAGRINHLMQDLNVDPSEVLCITFSNAGAKEMKRKIEKEAGKQLPTLNVMTFNAFGFEIVKREYEELGYKRPVNVINDVQRFSIIRDLLSKNPIHEWSGVSFRKFTSNKGFGKKGALRIVADIFSEIKASDGDSAHPCVDLDHIGTYDMNLTAKMKVIAMYDQFVAKLKNDGLVEFADQEILAMRILEDHPGYLDAHYDFKHIIVDEYQDTSEIQTEFCKYLKNMSTFQSLMVVGDDAQSIYGFRNTSPEYLIHFADYINAPHKHFTKSTSVLPVNRVDAVQDIFLVNNYRSSQEILDTAGIVLARNRDKVDKHLIAMRGHGQPVFAKGYVKKVEEVESVVKSIEQKVKSGTKPEDIAIITYTKDELKTFSDALTKKGIPSMFGAPEPLFENSRIQAILAFSRYLRDQGELEEMVAANALLRGNILDADEIVRLEILENIKERRQAILDVYEDKKKELFLRYVQDIAMEDEAIEHFCTAFDNLTFDEMQKYCRDFHDLGEDEQFRRIEDYPGVMLITAHSSKGLEWPVVYNCIDKYINGDMYGSRKNIEEARRLLYVSMTRARDELYVVATNNVQSMSRKDAPYQNFFLEEVKEAVLRVSFPSQVK